MVGVVVDFRVRGAGRTAGIGTRGSGRGGRGRGRERDGFWGRGVGFIRNRPRCATGNGQEAQTPGRGEKSRKSSILASLLVHFSAALVHGEAILERNFASFSEQGKKTISKELGRKM